MELDKEIRELKRRLDLAETRLSQLEGRFEFISGQLRDIQLYMHARFDAIDERFDRMEKSLRGEMKTSEQNLRADMKASEQSLRADMKASEQSLRAEVQAIPRVVAEMLAERR